MERDKLRVRSWDIQLERKRGKVGERERGGGEGKGMEGHKERQKKLQRLQKDRF